MNRRDIRSLITLAVFALACAPALATTYYVATTGNEGAVGTNWDTALLTISNAVAKCGSGDTVLVSNGTVRNRRIMDGIVDMGAYENRPFPSTVLTVR